MEMKKITTQKITPCLWFSNNAEEAAKFYTSIFKNSGILKTTWYGKNMPLPEGTVLTVKFLIAGQEYLALNGGPLFTFSEAISFMVSCDTQKEIDDFWSKLSEGGTEQQCGWLKDRFGLSWQIVPTELNEWMQSGDSERSNRVMQAIMPMVKLDLEKLRIAYNG